MPKLRTPGGPRDPRDPTSSPDNVVPIRTPRPVGPVTWAEYHEAAIRFVREAGPGPTLDARRSEDAARIRTWVAFVVAIGGRGSWLHERLTDALTLPGGSLSQVTVPTRMPSEFTGDRRDDAR